MDWKSVVEELDTGPDQGLSSQEVQARIEKYGENKIPESKKRSTLMRLLAQFHNVLIYLLIGTAVITALLDHWIDTFVILGVVIINALIGFIQEGKAEKALDSIRQMMSLEAVVIRDGKRQTINAEKLVPGDIVLLKSGDKVPADIRIVKSKNLRVEESALTGESTDVNKTQEAVQEEVVLGDRKSMGFAGSLITYGEATGVVVETGEQTEIGKITQMISDVEVITTPLLQKIDNFGKYLSVFILVVAGAFFGFGYYFRDYTMVELFMATIGMVVAAIPEGLPAIMTITLAVGVQRMARRNAIIRHLPSVETLGSVNVICSDKTGTLTRNEMTAKSVITADALYTIEGSGYKPEGKILKQDQAIKLTTEPALEKLMETIRACNDSQLSEDESGEWNIEGTATEGSLMALAHKGGLKEFEPKRIDSVPFESEHKYMATLNVLDDQQVIYVKGAPERILNMCPQQFTAEGLKELDQEFWQQQIDAVAAKGERVIAAAYRIAPPGQDSIEKEDLKDSLVFLGLIGIIDPPREEALIAIKECKAAGIRVIMITGDHAITAQAIAKELGINDSEQVAVTGTELERMDDNQMREVVKSTNVFARTSPEHKLRLVQALQANNMLCAMTGDGVNDAPALKRANIGIAMGIKGTEVSKSASEMILVDDNFATIVSAIEEGRTVYDNLRKTILFMLPTNGAEALVLIAAILIGISLPITPLQILWVNMVTAVTLALALILEPTEGNVMKHPPRPPEEPILGSYFIWRIFFVSTLIGLITFASYWMVYEGPTNLAVAQTIAVNVLVAGQLFYLFNCRKIHDFTVTTGFFQNVHAFYAAGTLILLQLIFTYTPLMNTLFGTTALTPIQWSFALVGGLMVFVIVELEKLITRRFF